MSKATKDNVTTDSTDSPVVENEVYDFTVHPISMDPKTEWAYGQLRRMAMIRNDQSILPAGKKMTRIEIETILGREIGEADIPRQCCG
jgi:hypothetical protein